MMSKYLNTPVLLIIFNRPDTTEKVFKQIRKAKPSRLYIAADGPRQNKKDETEQCNLARSVVEMVDWKCEVKTQFQEKNLGCGYGPIAAIDWFFQNEEYGIVLEDDCLPHPSFFQFCEDLLIKYATDDRIMHINGNNFGARPNNFSISDNSYHFCSFPQVWGWAGWSRSWRKFSWKIEYLSQLISQGYLKNIIQDDKHQKIQIKRWNKVKNGLPDIWDYQWQYSVISNHGLCIVPKTNLISNIGFGEGATHSRDVNSSKSNIKTEEIDFPLNHPEISVPDRNLNKFYEIKMLGNEPFISRVKIKLNKLLN